MTTLDAFLNVNHDLREEITNVLGSGSPMRWHEVAVKLSAKPGLSGKITGSWINEVTMFANPQNGPSQAARFITKCMGMGILVKTFSCCVGEASLGVLEEKIADRLKVYESKVGVPTPTQLPVTTGPVLQIYRWEKVLVGSTLGAVAVDVNAAIAALLTRYKNSPHLAVIELNLTTQDPIVTSGAGRCYLGDQFSLIL